MMLLLLLSEYTRITLFIQASPKRVKMLFLLYRWGHQDANMKRYTVLGKANLKL